MPSHAGTLLSPPPWPAEGEAQRAWWWTPHKCVLQGGAGWPVNPGRGRPKQKGCCTSAGGAALPCQAVQHNPPPIARAALATQLLQPLLTRLSPSEKSITFMATVWPLNSARYTRPNVPAGGRGAPQSEVCFNGCQGNPSPTPKAHQAHADAAGKPRQACPGHASSGRHAEAMPAQAVQGAAPLPITPSRTMSLARATAASGLSWRCTVTTAGSQDGPSTVSRALGGLSRALRRETGTPAAEPARAPLPHVPPLPSPLRFSSQ